MQKPGPTRYVYPLNALFILVTACSVVAALLTPVVRAIAGGPVGVPQAMMSCFAGALYASGLGGVVGLYHFNRRRGFAWGALTGAALGAALGPVALAPVQAFPSLISISLGGSALLVAIAAGFRWTKK
jgi:uncharacterized membrane protein